MNTALKAADDQLSIPELSNTKDILQKGFLHFACTSGLLKYGLPFAVMTGIIGLNITHSVFQSLAAFLLILVTFGAALARLEWNTIKASADNRALKTN